MTLRRLWFALFCFVVFPIVGCAGSSATTTPPITAARATAPVQKTVVADVSSPTCAAADPNAEPIAFGSEKMIAICRDVFVDPSTSVPDQLRLRELYGEAGKALQSAFGSVVSNPPVTIFCKTAPCVADFAGSSRRSRVLGPHGQAPGGVYRSGDRPSIIMDFEGPGAKEVLVHELTHIEMFTRLGKARTPNWFDEGLAFSLANQRTECTNVPEAIDDLRRLDHGWMEFTDSDFQKKMRPAYCQAGTELDAWLHRYGRGGLLALIGSLKQGISFQVAYGPMLTQTSAAIAADDKTFDHTTTLSKATALAITLTGDPDSFARTGGYTDLADADKPFSIAMWIKPARSQGTLAHVSSNADGTGWCIPFLGFDEHGQLVAQVIQGQGEGESEFVIARSPTLLVKNEWAFVVMTWKPHGSNRLYVNGVKVAETAGDTYRGRGDGSMFVTWGSSVGAACWKGAIEMSGFAGEISQMSVFDTELAPTQIAAMAHTRH
jgi:Concanavalin A-like lectin/glucanases superfamily